MFLVSSDFLASDYHNQVEVKRALERQKAGLAHVIPIILRPSDWEDTALGHLLPLPKDGKPIITWRYRDEAFLNVAEGIKHVLQLREPEPEKPDPQEPLPGRGKRTPGSFPPVWNVPWTGQLRDAPSQASSYPMHGFGNFDLAVRFCRAFDELRNSFRFRSPMEEYVSLPEQRHIFLQQRIALKA